MEHLPVVLASFSVSILFTLMFCAFAYDLLENKKIKFYQNEIDDLKYHINELNINKLNIENSANIIEFENSLLKKENIYFRKKLNKMYKRK